MPGVTSLLKSAQSTQKKIRSQEEAEIAYEWSISQKTYDQYLQYKSYLDENAAKSSDPSEILSYRKKTNSAYSAYTSNEIQRQSINVIEGRGSNSDKYNSMYGLYDAAVKNGNYDLAQSLNLQLDNLSIKIQNEAEKVQAVAGQMAAYNVKSVKALTRAIKDDMTELGRVYQDRGPAEFDKFLNDKGVQDSLIASNPALAELFASGAKVGFWDIAKGAADQIKETYQSAINTMSPEDAADFKEELEKIEFGETKFNIPGVGKVTIDDMQKQADAVRAGGTYFYKGADNTMKAGTLTNYTWAKGADGKYKLIQQYAAPGTSGQLNPFTGDQTAEDTDKSQVMRIDSKGNIYDSVDGKIIGKKKDGEYYDSAGNKLDGAAKNDLIGKASTKYEDMLKAAGFVVNKNGNGYTIRGTEDTASWFKIPGLDTDEPVNAVIDPQGNLRFTRKDAEGNDQLYQVAFDEYGQTSFKQLKEGEQGSIGASDLYDVRQTQNMLKQSTGSFGMDKGNESLSSTLDTLKAGDRFTQGKLQDPLFRAEWIKQTYLQTPEQRLTAAQQRGDVAEIKRAQDDINATKLSGLQRPLAAIQSAVPKTADAIRNFTGMSTPGMAAANRSLAASNQAVQAAPAKYGVFSGGFGQAFKNYFTDTQKNGGQFSSKSVPARYVVSNKISF